MTAECDRRSTVTSWPNIGRRSSVCLCACVCEYVCASVHERKDQVYVNVCEKWDGVLFVIVTVSVRD